MRLLNKPVWMGQGPGFFSAPERNLSTRMRQRLREFYEGIGTAGGASASRRGVCAVA